MVVFGEVIININASRIGTENRVLSLLQFLDIYKPHIVCIQEIDVITGTKVFSNNFQVMSNFDHTGNNFIGMLTLIRKGVKVKETLIGLNGRILGVKLQGIQVWNVYPPSGTEYRNAREIFFREDLSDLMMNWKDHTKFIIQAGDHNCTHRLEDSLYNPGQHLQQGLVSHLKLNGLKDDFLVLNGRQVIEYSRVTNRSRTRIDYIFSNTNSCKKFEYVDSQLGFDHKVVVAEYDLGLVKEEEFIPKESLFKSWVIPSHLEEDKQFIKDVESIYETVYKETLDEEEAGEEVNYSMYWCIAKENLIKVAREREKEKKVMEEERVRVLQLFYQANIRKINEGIDSKEDLVKIKKELDVIYKNRSRQAVSRIRNLLVEDHMYDMNKVQRERKYENGKKVNEIKIGNETYKGTANVVRAIQEKMKMELIDYSGLDRDDPPTEEEEAFLNLIPEVNWSDEEAEELIAPTTEEEIARILRFEVDVDSSPGEDGITYRFMKKFWKFSSYRKLYIKFLNYTRKIKSMGVENNIGVMVVKNKSVQSIEYDKKRKLTKVNKDSNLGHGKVWTNRLKKLVLPKILPKMQYNCQEDINIVDEICEIRSVNQYLLGKAEFGQVNGTILSIDFNNAYRSTSLRWFNLVMKRFGIPIGFIDWFWMMYKNLGKMIVIYDFKSEIMQVKRGFMEGHPPSMGAFVISMIPLMIALEGTISGIMTPDLTEHKVKAFADDLKVFIADLREISMCYNEIEKFEVISGLKMHRDPQRGKCQALPFGSHREYMEWPEWISVRDCIKVVGIIYTNKREEFEKVNTKLVSQNFYNALQKVSGMRGTLFQKVYVVNTFLFSKLWYVCQAVQLEKNELENILKRAFDFIYAGENERPVRALNFRDKSLGGLGLINPLIKAKALLMKNMIKEFKNYDCSFDDDYMKDNLYGYSEEFQEILLAGFGEASVKDLYNYLMQDVLLKNGSVIPSRSEKKIENIKWRVVWNNLKILQRVSPEEKEFAWKVTQDMVAVGKRIHRRNTERRCLKKLTNGEECQYIPDLFHALMDCEGINDTFKEVTIIVEGLLDREIEGKDIIMLNFNHRNKKRLKLIIWFVVKSLYGMHIKKLFNKRQLFNEIWKELDWNVSLMKRIGALDVMILLKDKLRSLDSRN